MQRLYSEFPGAYPELELLLLRLLTCGMFISFEGARLTAMVAESHTVVNSLLGVLLIAASVLVLAGVLRPVAGLLMAVIESVGTIFQIVNPESGGELSWIYSPLTTRAASTLALIGPRRLFPGCRHLRTQAPLYTDGHLGELAGSELRRAKILAVAKCWIESRVVLKGVDRL